MTFSASPTSIPNGQSSTLAWTSANATACSGTGKGFSPSGPSGSIAVSPKTTTTYGITCTGAGGSASQSVTVTVTAAATLTIGMTVAAARHDLRLLNSNAEYVRDRLRGVRQPGRGHRRSSRATPGDMVAGSLRRRPYRVGLSERSRGRIANGADTLVQRESCEHRPRRLVDAYHGRRPTRLPAAESASLHRASQDLSPSRRLQAPCTASPARAVADLRQLNR